MVHQRKSLKKNIQSPLNPRPTYVSIPKLEYASQVRDPYKIEHINDLERVQRRAARIVTNRHRNISSVG